MATGNKIQDIKTLGMKNSIYIIGLWMLLWGTACTRDNDSVALDQVAAPNQVSALTTITQDNTGKVTITPRGEGVTRYEIYYGDGTTDPAYVNPGGNTTHVYPEGTYNLRIVGVTLNGKRTESTQPLTVSYVAPTNLQVTIAPNAANPMQISVSATADLETFFQVYFGDVPNETPTQFIQGDTITHTYANTGTYTVTVVALSGGTATTTYTQTVTISNPILLPIDFQSSTLNYAFTNFGGAIGTVVNNPNINATNTSSKVGQLIKVNGAETWAGAYLTLGQPIDLSSLKKISMKVWAPQSGITVKMKLENLSDPNTNIEVDVTNTQANAWETLTFDFSAANTSNSYQKLVVFFDFGHSGTGQTFYFDDIQQTSGLPTLGLPLTFESALLTYTFTDFGGAITTVEPNTVSGGINTSNKIAKQVKGAGAQTWAGSFIDMAAPIDFSSLHKIKMKVWSPQAGITVKFKMEKLGNSNINIERDATTTTSNAWEELTYDFSGIVNSNNYQRVVVFFNFGAAGTGTTYYFDDIRLSN